VSSGAVVSSHISRKYTQILGRYLHGSLRC
jgi:hypothetical protein